MADVRPPSLLSPSANRWREQIGFVRWRTSVREMDAYSAGTRSLILRIRSLLWLPKFPVPCRREFTLEVPDWRAQFANERAEKGRIQTNSLYFSLLAGNEPAGDWFAADCFLRHRALK